MANNHSAEFLRGAKWWADQHTTGYKQLCALLAAAEAREAGEPTAAEVIAACKQAFDAMPFPPHLRFCREAIAKIAAWEAARR